MNENTYKRTQFGWVIVIALGLACLCTAVAAMATPSTTRLLVFGILATCLLLFPTLTVVGSEAGIEVRFGPGVIRRKFAWNEIRAARPVKNSWLAGWGIRWTGTGWLFNVSGLDAVELSLKSGKRFRIGTDDPRGLNSFIVQHLAETK